MRNQGEIVHHARDGLGGLLVIDYRKHRILTFDSVFEQSKIDRRWPHLPVHEYSRAMMLPAAFVSPRHVTVLGLGGGVMASAFYHLFADCHIHAIELRSIVRDTAHEFFSLPRSERVQVTVGDARAVLEKQPDASTDLILADLYNADRMSPAQAQRRFIDHCSRVLRPEGWLTLNYHRTPDPEGPYFRQLKRQFAILLVFRSKSNNTVIYASKRPFAALAPKDPRLLELEKRLPIDWRQLMAKVIRLGAEAP